MGTHILQKEAEKGSNFVFSPLSFLSMLSLLAAGSKGSTLEKLLSFLGPKDIDEVNSLALQIVSAVTVPANENEGITGGPNVSFANGAWVDRSCRLKPSFEELAKRIYGATVKEVDLSNKDQILCSRLSFHGMMCPVAVDSRGSTLQQLLPLVGSQSVSNLCSFALQIRRLDNIGGPMVSFVNGSWEDLIPENENEDPNGGPNVSFASGAWVDQRYRLKPSFQEVAERIYAATVKEVDLSNKASQVVSEVNTWVENETKGLIKDILPPGSLSGDTALVLANALYFKGAWDRKFEASKTKSENFHLLNGSAVKVPFMTCKPYQSHFYGSYDGYKVLKIPYRSGQDNRKFSMYFFLPHARDGLPNLVQLFKSNPELYNRKFRLADKGISELWIPRFKFSFKFEASNAMRGMGLESLFSNLGAFTEMVDSPESLSLSKVFHQSCIEHQEVQRVQSNSNTNFSLGMAINILLQEGEKGSNFVFSPLSFHAMMCLIAVGSRGSTLEQLLSFLGSKGTSELNSFALQIKRLVLLPANENQDTIGGPTVSFVNGAWVDQSFHLKPSFLEVVENVYGATAKEHQEVKRVLSNSNTNFSLGMAINILLQEGEKGSNFVFSPLSFHAMMCLIAVGSRGSTLEQLLSFIGSKGISDLHSFALQIKRLLLLPANENQDNIGGPTVSFVNGAWVDKSFHLKPSFLEVVENVYGATANEVDFLTKIEKLVSLSANERQEYIGGPVVSFVNGAWVDRSFRLKPSFVEVVEIVYGATAKEVDFSSKDILSRDWRFPPTNTNHLKTDFSLLMTNKLLLEQVELGSNFVASPLSIHLVLSIVAAGSTGRTLEQLLSFLGSRSISELNHLSAQIVDLTSSAKKGTTGESLASGKSSPEVLSINVVWIDQDFRLKPSFERITKDVFRARTEEVDFGYKAEEARHEVNTWVKKETKGLIKELLPSGSIDSKVVLVLANALYFKGAWNQMFDASRTQLRDFQLLNGETAQVPFMPGSPFEDYLYGSFDGYKVLQLPYQSGGDTRQFSMYFFLPDKRDGLFDLVKMLSSKPGFFNQQFALQREELTDFWIPRFKFSAEFEATETMKEMGLDLPFMTLGEFKEMVTCSAHKLYVSKVFHKACIEVNEEGTEAAASSAVVMRQQCARFPVPNFVADHPFMLMIREEKSGIVFFTGAVLNPLLED
ncbi:hypothetical protein Tsubulata_001075 [Turnera subulata]|uniref:Serpin domain-containing protein n=1 Tax=Turnera subulata TaxID=218843 RepID=A0A9Q0FKD5_9ROSI|nr:hypothetical protein Tsubulata_001075 [Turnera subulata]